MRPLTHGNGHCLFRTVLSKGLEFDLVPLRSGLIEIGHFLQLSPLPFSRINFLFDFLLLDLNRLFLHEVPDVLRPRHVLFGMGHLLG